MSLFENVSTRSGSSSSSDDEEYATVEAVDSLVQSNGLDMNKKMEDWAKELERRMEELVDERCRQLVLETVNTVMEKKLEETAYFLRAATLDNPYPDASVHVEQQTPPHQPTTPNTTSRRKKFSWRESVSGESFIREMCAASAFSLEMHVKMNIFRAGGVKGVWEKSNVWKLRVFHQIDNVAKAQTQ